MKNLQSESGLSRRGFLAGSMGVFGAGALAGPLAFLRTKKLAEAAEAGSSLCGTRGDSPYGPLYPTADMATGLELILLPRGFSYVTFSWRGDLMDDGNPVPRGHDGMAVVGTAKPGQARGPVDGRALEVTLIRNHEVFGLGTPIAPDYNYDSQGPGGTTVLQFKNGQLLSHRVSISGTSSNCAGGPTPWGSWITCEEGTPIGDQPHGYAFESTVTRVTGPAPIKAMGRFAHEAVAFDPRTGFVYETEDNSGAGSGDPNGRNRGQSGFYKFEPNNPLGGVGSLEAGGRLFMLKAVGPNGPVDDLRDPECFSTFDVEWVEIQQPDAPPDGTLRASGPYLQGRAGGATRFQRLEGCWWDPVNQLAYFVDTEGGPIGADSGRTDRAEGAVWAYDPAENTLTCVFVSQGALAPSFYGADNPDNVSVSPRGGVILCEDGDRDDGNGLSMLGLLPSGQTFEFARNIISIGSSDADALVAAGHDPAVIGTGDFSGQEWAGATFDPTGRWLFANIQTPGITFAITGPWAKGIF